MNGTTREKIGSILSRATSTIGIEFALEEVFTILAKEYLPEEKAEEMSRDFLGIRNAVNNRKRQLIKPMLIVYSVLGLF